MFYVFHCYFSDENVYDGVQSSYFFRPRGYVYFRVVTSRVVIKTKMEEEENAPLLSNVGENPTDIPNPREKIRSLYASDRVLGRHSPYNGIDVNTINITASNSIQNIAEVDHIVAIFVVAFDTKAGAWQVLLYTNNMMMLGCTSAYCHSANTVHISMVTLYQGW